MLSAKITLIIKIFILKIKLFIFVAELFVQNKKILELCMTGKR